MQPSGSLQFPHPEPSRPKNSVWPVFLPFSGCPFRCVYCSQHLQTGQKQHDHALTGRKMFEDISHRFKNTGRAVGLGFFGGTFTAMDRADMVFFLEKADKLKSMGAVNHIRCSTRPDCLGPEVLDLLKTFQVDMIELGIQSFSPEALSGSFRGYTRDTALKACRSIQSRGFQLGVQLMPGMPGHKPRDFLKDMDLTASLAPDAVRLYPCLVLKNTALETMYKEGKFQPWSLSAVFHLLAPATLKFWLSGIPVIRTGLAPEAELCGGIVAGPWHPAMGAVCRSLALRTFILYQAARIGKPVKKILVPQRYVSDFRGWKNINIPSLKKAGITMNMVESRPEELFRISF